MQTTRRRVMGQLLVQRGVLTPQQLGQVLEVQGRSDQRLASLCLARGLASEDALLGPLSEQKGVPGVALARVVIPLAALDAVAPALATERCILPLRMDADRVFVAVADPEDEGVLAEIAFLNGRQVMPAVALRGPLRQTIDAAYGAKRRGELEYRGPLATDADSASAPLPFVYPDGASHIPPALISPPFFDLAGDLDADHEAILVDLDGMDESGDIEVQSGMFELPPTGPALSVRRTQPDEPPARTPEVVPEANELPEGGTPPRRALRVLLVDDDEELLRLMARLLRGRGLQVEETRRGLEALAAVKANPPDLIVLDAMLPELHGFDICRKLKSSERYGQIPIIMVSSVYRGWRIAQDLKDSYGVEVFLEKPFKINALWTAVERVLSSRSRRPVADAGMTQSAERAYREGLARHRDGDLDGAIASLREGIRIDPFSPKLHLQLGVLYLKKRMVYQAMHAFEEAVTLDPTMFSALRSLAVLYQRRGFKNNAIDMWERALHHSPDEETGEQIRRHLLTLL